MLSLDLGDGVTLAPLEPWQAAEFAAFVDSERAFLEPWLPFAVFITDTASAAKFLQRYADNAASDGPRIWCLRQNGAMVGGTLFKEFDPKYGVCEVGVWLAEDAQGKGTITRAVTAMLDWAVGVRGMHRVEWRCSPDNLASRSAAQRLGMTLEGTLREAFEHDGRQQDMEVWALLAPEWRARTT
jgi:ribosomal-protein-serine acetyltransferase